MNNNEEMEGEDLGVIEEESESMAHLSKKHSSKRSLLSRRVPGNPNNNSQHTSSLPNLVPGKSNQSFSSGTSTL